MKIARAIVVGSGLAGLSTALALAERKIPVTVLSRYVVSAGTSSGWAQGGISAAMGDDDNPSLHAEDTLAAGAGLCDPEIVKLITDAAPDAIRWLQAQGVEFDCDANGKLKLGLEGAHNRRRIVHARGDSTGAMIMTALTKRVREVPEITILENVEVTGLQCSPSGVDGVWLRRENETPYFMAAQHVVLATGGTGALWRHTTNPLSSWGHGLALAARAGAVLRDMEFVQFHPTGMDVGRDPMPLASEALRGEGAQLIDENGVNFMSGYAQGALSPRDVVARTIWAQLQAGHKVFLDARMITDFARRFPAIHAFCAAAGIDPETQPIPVHPTAHYHMGGVKVDADGRSTVPGLWACGEVSSTGLHGANRLASNSLLEAVVMGKRAAVAIADTAERKLGLVGTAPIFTDPLQGVDLVRTIMSAHVGVLRDRAGLTKAVATLGSVSSDMALVGMLIATAALRRQESRGAQARTDYTVAKTAWQKHQDITIKDIEHGGAEFESQRLSGVEQARSTA